ncbi:DUF547 domain-containing protein [Stieleria sp. ICT_E10.1]|uniref:DUF547 domain-containing protein n=1 Tax=Stieleria sedimenti TaxID=2976331 RepID=UPI00217F66B4|nr:DUF547 domain-containing protein [Stieleria sedimenti]MCS7465332.1 DUF547 domain-containing protein [Stieleria sedimenti]
MNRRVPTALTLAAALALSIAATRHAVAGTPVYVGDAKAKLVPMHTIDHSSWNKLLATYVDSDGRVDYKRWHASRPDQTLLDDYLKHLSTASIAADEKTTQAHRLAFWINAYNALTIKGILREYPTTSIRNHTPKLWGYHIWHDLKLHVGHQPFSLDEIEHQVLRKMGEPRIHFAIVCASIGCPRLLSAAYVPEHVDEQLTTNTKDFFSRSQNFRHDVSEKRFYLSAILKWFGEDFGDGQSEVLRRIAGWLPDSTARRAALGNAVSIAYLDYDWQLNAQSAQ